MKSDSPPDFRLPDPPTTEPPPTEPPVPLKSASSQEDTTSTNVEGMGEDKKPSSLASEGRGVNSGQPSTDTPADMGMMMDNAGSSEKGTGLEALTSSTSRPEASSSGAQANSIRQLPRRPTVQPSSGQTITPAQQVLTEIFSKQPQQPRVTGGLRLAAAPMTPQQPSTSMRAPQPPRPLPGRINVPSSVSGTPIRPAPSVKAPITNAISFQKGSLKQLPQSSIAQLPFSNNNINSFQPSTNSNNKSSLVNGIQVANNLVVRENQHITTESESKIKDEPLVIILDQNGQLVNVITGEMSRKLFPQLKRHVGGQSQIDSLTSEKQRPRSQPTITDDKQRWQSGVGYDGRSPGGRNQLDKGIVGGNVSQPGMGFPNPIYSVPIINEQGYSQVPVDEDVTVVLLDASKDPWVPITNDQQGSNAAVTTGSREMYYFGPDSQPVIGNWGGNVLGTDGGRNTPSSSPNEYPMYPPYTGVEVEQARQPGSNRGQIADYRRFASSPSQFAARMDTLSRAEGSDKICASPFTRNPHKSLRV